MPLLTRPYPFQAEAIAACTAFGGRCLLAMEPGLGKSLCAIGFALERGLESAVVVCPASIKWVWQEQWRLHAGVEATVLSGRARAPDYSGVLVVNYDVLHDHLPYLLGRRLIILDECHALCGRTTRRTKAVRQLCAGVPHVLALSGTPLVNRPAELWPVLNVLRPETFGGFYSFAHRFCAPKRSPFGGWDYRGHANLDQLNELLLGTVMFRRRRREVMADLPAKIRNVVPLEMADAASYLAAERDLVGWLAANEPEKLSGALRSQGLARTGHLKRLAARAKLPAVVGWVEGFLDSGRKLILFGHHLENLHAVAARFADECVLIEGATPERERQRRTQAFNGSESVRLLVANAAAAAGWSATGCSDVAFMELQWQPGVHQQMEDRVVGIGRGAEGETPASHWLVGRDSIEVRICRIVQAKQRVLDAVLDGGEVEESGGVYDDLVREMR